MDLSVDLQDGGPESPFFVYLAYNAPHFPIQPPEDYLEQGQERETGLSEKRAKNVAFIEHLDDSVGQVMKVLHATGLDKNTLVVFTSDNGGALRYEQSNGKLRGGKQDMYEGGIRVPTFMRWKNVIPAGSSTKNFGMLMDLLPTFSEIAGVEESRRRWMGSACFQPCRAKARIVVTGWFSGSGVKVECMEARPTMLYTRGT